MINVVHYVPRNVHTQGQHVYPYTPQYYVYLQEKFK